MDSKWTAAAGKVAASDVQRLDRSSAVVLRTQADPLYLFCTCTRAFCRFSLIELFTFLKSFENSPMVADRLPPPPPLKLFYPLALAGSLLSVSTMSPNPRVGAG